MMNGAILAMPSVDADLARRGLPAAR